MKIANGALRQSGAERFQFETPLRNAASAKTYSLLQLSQTDQTATVARKQIFWRFEKTTTS